MPSSNPIPLEYKLGFHDEINYSKSVNKGISEKIIREISRSKSESEWMLDFRLKSLSEFKSLTMPSWAPKIDINFDNFT
ncbi:MAG: Fe-S cluster assembly protein SufB, partial [bacterium]|nr:Fe-S cluster assembly protein SufB [bacterium]